MKRPLSLLDAVQIVEPCHVPWDGMTGDDTSRFCTQCNKSVHDLSAMVRVEAEAFCRQNPSACLRITRNDIGDVVTSDSVHRGWFQKLKWLIPAWLGLSTGFGCGTNVTCTAGVPVPPRLIASVEPDDVRSALAAAAEPSRLIGSSLQSVFQRFGVRVNSETEWILVHVTFENTKLVTKGFRIESSAGDDVWIYFSSPDTGPVSTEWETAKSYQVIGIAVRNKQSLRWTLAGEVDPALHRD